MRIDRRWALARAVGPAIGLLALISLASPAEATSTGTRTSSFAYDTATGLLTQEVVEPNTTALKVATVYTYDAYGNKLAATVSGVDIATRTSSNAYDSRGQFATAATNALNQSENWTYDARGLPTSQTGPNGLTTTWTYDAFGRKTLETRSDGTKTTFAYEYCSALVAGTCPTYAVYRIKVTPLASNGVTQNGPIVQTYYDGLGRVVTTLVQNFGAGYYNRTDTQYDALGRVLKVSRAYFLSGGTPKWIVNAYDALGRVTQTTAPDGSVTTFAYHGLTGSVTNAKGQTKTTVKNAQGLVASVTDAIGKVTAYAYDAFGNLVKTTDSAGNVSTATYDTAGRKTAMHDPDMGNWSYSYDVLGQLKSQTDAKGQVTTLTYDKLGRTTQRVEPGLTSTWVYDTAPMGVGKLASATTDHGYSRSLSYDGQGRPSQTAITILGDTSTFSTYYDANGRVSMVAYPSGFMVQYGYNTLGYLTQLKDANSTQVFWTANAMDAELHLTQVTAGNGVVTNQSFNANTGLVAGIQAGLAGSPTAAANFTYTFDTIGNLTARADVNQGLNESFQYDTLNRLTQYQIVGGAVKTVAYDDLGNITSKSDVGAYAYPASGLNSVRPHAVSAIAPSGTGAVSTTFTYDANGNMLTGMGRAVAWTAANMVASITQGTKTVTFDYDGEHARMRQVTSSGTTLYLADAGSGISAEKFTGTSGSVQWNEYLLAGGKMVGEHFTNISGASSSVATRYFVADHLGSIAVITDEAGAVVERLSYDAWGKRRFPTGADDPTGSITSQTTRGFTGHEMIDDVGLVNMNGRVYDPQLGRFMSADPFVQFPDNAQSYNRYAYVLNNPLSFTDPTGHFLGLIGDWLHLIVKLFTSPIVSIAVMLIVAPYLASLMPELLPETFAATTAGKVAAIGLSGGAVGFLATGTLKGAGIYALTAEFFAGIHLTKDTLGLAQDATLASDPGAALASAGMHAVAGGVTSSLAGEGFRSRFVAAGLSDLAGFNSDVERSNMIGHAIVGGFGSLLGGGKFQNGAITGAFGYLYNEAGRGPVDRHELGRQAALEDAVSQGYEVVSPGETSVSLPGLPSRRYDFVILDPATAQQIGAEVKTSWWDLIFLDRRQVNFDKVVATGNLGPARGITDPRISITQVFYYTYCFQCKTGIAQLRSLILAGELMASGVSVYPGRRLQQ